MYVINYDDEKVKEHIRYINTLFIDKNAAVYFDSFGIEYLPLEVLDRIRNKSITHNVFRMQDNESIMCGFFCITIIEYMLAGKPLLVDTNLLSPNEYKKWQSNI